MQWKLTQAKHNTETQKTINLKQLPFFWHLVDDIFR